MTTQAGAPIAGMTATFGTSTMVTNATGRYTFTNVPCQTGTLTFTKAGYAVVQEHYTPVCGTNTLATSN